MKAADRSGARYTLVLGDATSPTARSAREAVSGKRSGRCGSDTTARSRCAVRGGVRSFLSAPAVRWRAAERTRTASGGTPGTRRRGRGAAAARRCAAGRSLCRQRAGRSTSRAAGARGALAGPARAGRRRRGRAAGRTRRSGAAAADLPIRGSPRPRRGLPTGPTTSWSCGGFARPGSTPGAPRRSRQVVAWRVVLSEVDEGPGRGGPRRGAAGGLGALDVLVHREANGEAEPGLLSPPPGSPRRPPTPS
jgi:hypothetical protein